MPLKRTPPHTPASPAKLAHCKSDSNINKPTPVDSIDVPTISREYATSDPNITVRKRKREDEITRTEILKMFSELQNKQEEKFKSLMTQVQSGINMHTDQNKDIAKSIDFLAVKYDEMVTKISSLEREKTADRKYIQSLEARLEQMDRSLRSSSLEVRNIPKKAGETKEDLINIVKKVGSALSVTVHPAEVRDIYRINTKNENNQPIVAELTSVIVRDRIVGNVKAYNKKYTTSKFSTSNIKLEGPAKPIFVSESLTMQTKKLFFLAREFSKEHDYKYCWSTRGRVYLRRAEGAPLIKVNHVSDLENLNSK